MKRNTYQKRNEKIELSNNNDKLISFPITVTNRFWLRETLFVPT